MNTKVKVGIAAAIVAALVALIVLDQKTTPKDDSAKSGGGAAIDASGSSTADAPLPRVNLNDQEATNLYQKANQIFSNEQHPKPAPGAGIKGAPEENNEKRIKAAPGEIYEVKAGDTLETIAQAKLGSKSYSSLIAEANPGVKPNQLRIGTKLNLPCKPEKKDAVVAEKQPETDKAKVVIVDPAPKDPGAQSFVGAKSYQVQQGDTLSGISMKVYNTSRHYQKIYEANKDLIDDPNTLQVGIKLSMPDLPVKGATANTGAPGSGVVPTTGPGPSPAPAPAGAKTVQVNEGDRLWTIAQKFASERKIGILDMIKLIVQANSDKGLREDGSNLRAGWQLIIPE